MVTVLKVNVMLPCRTHFVIKRSYSTLVSQVFTSEPELCKWSVTSFQKFHAIVVDRETFLVIKAIKHFLEHKEAIESIVNVTD